MKASAVLRIVFLASAPEPANAGPNAMAAAAATEVELIVDPSSASTRMSPTVERTPNWPVGAAVLAMPACTVFSIALSASDTAMATAKPAGASDAASAPAATSALIVDLSLAQTVTASPTTPSAPSPSMRARTLTALLLSADEPAPAPVAPKPRLATTAAAIASTLESMSCSEVAVTSTLSAALMPVNCV